MPRPRPLTAEEARRSLANRFAGTAERPGLADRLRQLSTKFGLRSLRVFLVWTRWSGETQGDGTERVLAEVELLPTPKVQGLGSINRQPKSAGVLKEGSVTVDEVSLTLSRDSLLGRVVPGRPDVDPSADEGRTEFFWELRDDGRNDSPARRMRFRVLGEPQRREGYVCWTVNLERASQDRQPDGTPEAWHVVED